MEVEERVVDSQGRISLPAKWRSEILRDSNEVIILHRNDELIIKPKREAKLSDFFDSIEVDIDPEVFSDYHKLKAALMKEAYQ